MTERPHPQAIIAALWQPQEDGTLPQIYAVLDGARDERIVPAVTATDLPWACLYRGELHPDLAAAAPYLVRLERDHPFTTWLLAHGWGESWGIFVKSSFDLDRVRRHLRTFLMVYDPDGQPLYFRWYDPRVLRVYLPTCNAEDLAVVFGKVVEAYCVEDDDPGQLGAFRRDALGVSIVLNPGRLLAKV